MGMLDFVKRAGGMLENSRGSRGYISALRAGANPLEARAMQASMARDDEYGRYLQERRAQEAKQLEAQAAAEQRKVDMAASQQAAASAVDMMTPEQKAAFNASAAQRAWWSGPDADKGVSEGVFSSVAPQQSAGKKIGERIGPDNVKYAVMQNPDGSTSEVPLGPQRATGQDAQRPANLQVFDAYKGMTPEDRILFERSQRAAPEPSSQSEKFVAQALDTQGRAMEQAGKIRTLANDISSVPDNEWVAGAPGRLSEFAKRTFGVEDNVTLIRTLANEVSMAKALSILPPGVASDRDVALAMSTTLPPTTNKQALLSWLRGAQKIAELRAQHANFQLQHMQNDPVTGLFTVGPAWQKYSRGLYDGKEAPASATATDMPDVTKMSDEELRALAGE